MEPYTPAFHKDMRIYPPFLQDGITPNDGSFWTSIRPREFATWETAQWVAKEFGGPMSPEKYPGGNAVEGSMTGPEIPQYCVFLQGMLFPCGHLAWYFTVRAADADPADQDAGYWDASTDPQQVMTAGKQIADKYVSDTAQFAEPPQGV